MAEIDPVILELRAELGKYRADLKSTTSMVEQMLNRQGRDAQRLEAQMRKSSGAIGESLRGIASTIGTYFTGRELAGMIDSFTRLQNSLKVAGLEGSKLESVQASLLDLSSKYGVGIEGLANLYGKATDAGRSFGASEAQVLQLTEATSQALKITGTNAAQASGAILGLSQALASGTVRAEEYNQINEGGLRPLLQAAAGAERFGGDINKLRAAMLDGKVSSQEFFAGIIAGAGELDAKASKATLTLSGAFEALSSSLTVYVGQSAEANGVTAALAGGMQLLADNLDTIIPAFAAIVAIIGVRYVAAAGSAIAANIALAASATGAAGSMGVMGAASFALQARLAGAATSTEALKFAVGGLAAALPTLAITGLVLAIGYMVAQAQAAEAAIAALRQESSETADRLDEMADKLEKAGVKTDEIRRAAAAARGDVSALADEFNRASVEAHKMADAYGAAALKIANLKIRESQARQEDLQGLLQAQQLGSPGGENPYVGNQKDTRSKLSAEKAFEAGQRGVINAVTTAFNNGVNLASSGGGSSAAKPDGKKKKGPKAPKDRTDELAARAAQDLYQLQVEELRAKAQITTDLEERADLERQILGMERDAREADIAAAVKSGDLTVKQAEAQREILDSLYGKRDAENAQGDILVQATRSLYGIQIERERRMQVEQDRADLAETEFRAESDALRNQYDLATTLDDRRRIALQILDAEDAYLRSKLEAVIANKDLTKAVQDQAKIELAALNASAGDRRKLVEQANQGPLDRYIEETRDTKTRVEEAMVRELQSVNDGITDALTKQLGIKNQFVKDLFSIFLDDVIFRPLAESLRNGQSGGGGLLGSLLQFGGSILGKVDPKFGNSGTAISSSVFGRASGGYVGPGQTVRVNEHAGGVELLRMGAQGGTVIPLGQTNARAASSSKPTIIQPIINVDARGAVMNDQFARQILSQANQNAVHVAGQVGKATLAAVPARMSSYQRDGT